MFWNREKGYFKKMNPLSILQIFLTTIFQPLVCFLTNQPMRYGNNHLHILLYILKKSEIHFGSVNRHTSLRGGELF
jgi:hypothetical protein